LRPLRFGWLRGPRFSVTSVDVALVVTDADADAGAPERACTRLDNACIAGSRSRIDANKGVAMKIDE
jgi:hypothetical protein